MQSYAIFGGKIPNFRVGDIRNWLNDTTGVFNSSGLVDNMKTKAGCFYIGTVADRSWLTENIKRGQDYLLHNTTLGIPALVQTEGGLKGFQGAEGGR